MATKTKYSNLVKLKDYQISILDETLESLQSTGQGAISLFTGGGKSFIGLKIALMYLEKHNGDVLWFGTNSANKNVYSSVIRSLPSKIKTRIHMKSYEQIWRGDDSLESSPDNTCFIVFDESHRALTRYATETILRIRDTYPCDKLAMSATQRRTSGIQSFKVLVPNAFWDDYNCNWAADNEVINQINYLVSNTKISSFDISQLESYRELGRIYPEINDKCDELEAMINNYHFNFGEDVYEVVKYSGMDLNESKGARHIVFFGSIAELIDYEDVIKGVYSKLYPNSTIRLFSYHSKISASAAKEVLDRAVNSEVEPYTVDIIATVDKGSESIHPRGIKSVMMFRHTQSYIKFIQQMGRGITLKEFSSDKSYIFDFSDGYVSLLRGNTIAYGRRDVADRIDDLGIDTLESLENKLRRVLSSNIKIKTTFATQRLRDLSNRLNELRDETTNGDKVKLLQRVIAKVKSVYPSEWKSMPSFDNLRYLYSEGMLNSKIEALDTKYTNRKLGLTEEFALWLVQISQLIIQESFDKECETYKSLIDMGHLIYLIKSSVEDETHLNTIDNILAYKKRMESNGLTLGPNTKPYKDLLNLKKLNFHDVLSVRVCTYARHNGLDLSADDISLSEIRKLSLPEDKDAFIAYSKEIRAASTLNELLNADMIEAKKNKIPQEYKVRSDIDVSDNVDDIDDAQLMWAALQAWHIINGVNYKSAYANFIRHKIEEQYKKELRFRTLSIRTETEGVKLVTILNNYVNTDNIINGTLQEYLFKHLDFKELSLIEVMILRIYGIKTNSKYRKIIDRTGWMQTYNKALEGDTYSLVQMERIDRTHLDDYRNKLISSKAFKQARIDKYQNMEPEILLKRAKSLDSTDKLLQNELSKALNNGTISSMQLIMAAFPNYLHKDVQNLLECSDNKLFKILEDDNWRNNQALKKICRAASSSASCISLVLGNILDVKGIDVKIAVRAGAIKNKMDEYTKV